MDDQRFSKLTENAKLIRSELQEVVDHMKGQVHFRPGVDGVSMVSLLPQSPQMGLPKIPKIEKFKPQFSELFEKHCRQAKPERPTPEKELQSFLIAKAYRDPRRLLPFDALELIFVTDEIPVHVENQEKVVCDLLAMRKNETGYVPVLIELKSSRDMKRLIEQVKSYARVIDLYIEHYSNLFSALLGKKIKLAGPCERWIVWPALWDEGDPRTGEFADEKIGIITYTKDKKSFTFWVGGSVHP